MGWLSLTIRHWTNVLLLYLYWTLIVLLLNCWCCSSAYLCNWLLFVGQCELSSGTGCSPLMHCATHPVSKFVHEMGTRQLQPVIDGRGVGWTYFLFVWVHGRSGRTFASSHSKMSGSMYMISMAYLHRQIISSRFVPSFTFDVFCLYFYFSLKLSPVKHSSTHLVQAPPTRCLSRSRTLTHGMDSTVVTSVWFWSIFILPQRVL